ncbi:MAG: hypothetical protein DWQ04_10590 [Chloroflexi bacterium]|nr:MAG: hypothetical protein DWQ04_10590 [Chloroflexota bacterium]
MPKATQIIHWRQRRQRRQRRGKRSIGQTIGVVLLLLVVGGFLVVTTAVLATAALYATLTDDLFTFSEVTQQYQTLETEVQPTEIFALGDTNSQGEQEWIRIHEISDPLGSERRWLSLEELPQHLIDATIAAEDPTFWNSDGVTLSDILQAVVQSLNEQAIEQKRPSIPQQLITQNVLPTTQTITNQTTIFRSVFRTIQLQLLVQQASNIYTKEQQLEWYLNSNFYGNLAYGVEAAAHVYFNKPVAELSLAESAMLSAIPQALEVNPLNNPDAMQTRQAQVLETMVEMEVVSAETAVTTQQLPLTFAPIVAERFDIIAPHFALYVQEALEKRFGPELVLGGGLQVYTSLNLSLQRQAECIARAQVNRLSGTLGPALPADEQASCPALDFLPPLAANEQGIDHNVNNAAIVMLNPNSGEIQAMVGSLNYWDETIDGSFNMAVDGLRQPGTAVTPFTYLTAFSQGYTAANMVLDVETTFNTINKAPFTPENATRQFHGPLRLRQAFASDLYVPAVQVMSWVGTNKVIRTAHSMGINTLDKGPYDLTLTQGGGEVTLLDMIYAYGVIDNMGMMAGQSRPTSSQQPGFRTLDPVAIVRVEKSDGTVLYDYTEPQQIEVLTPQLAYLMNDLLSDRNARCAGLGCPNTLELINNRPAAAKTGTTSDFRDAWTIGYTPELVTGVWIGNSNNQSMENVTGISGAAPIWQALMNWALADEAVSTWERPSNFTEIPVCNLSGLLPTPFCPTVPELFIAGTEPTVPDSMYQEFSINRETGRLATIYTPPELVETNVYVIYPEAAVDWAIANGIEQPPTEYDSIVTQPASADEVAITSPTNFNILREQIIITGTAQSDNFSFYRLAYFQGLQPNNIQTIADQQTEPQANGTLGIWDVRNLKGLYTLLLTVVREDGSFAEVTTHITIDNAPPQVELSFPKPDQQIFTDEAWVQLQAEAFDDVAMDRVEFYINNKGVPFAISQNTPFSERWPIPGPGCHEFHVVAVDAAGNESQSTAVSVCIKNRDA